MSFFVSRILKTFSSLITILLLKYYTNNEEVGEYLYWYVILLFSGLFIKFNSQVFFLGFKHEVKKYFFSFFLWQCCFLILFLVSAVFFVPIEIFWISLLFFVFFLFDPWEYLHTITKDYKLVNRIIIVVSIISIILKLVLVFFTKNYIYFLAINSLDFSVGTILFIITKNKKEYLIIFSKKNFVKVFIFVVPFLINTLLIYLTAKVDHFLIKEYFDFKELGVYGFVYRFYEGFFIFQVIFNSIIISKYRDNLKEMIISNGFYKFLKRWFYLSFLSLILVFVLLFVLYNHNALVHFKRELVLLIILLPGVFLSFFGVLISIKCSIEGYSKEVLVINLFTLIINILLNIILLPTLGIYAAAGISFFNQLLSSLILWLFFPRTKKYMIAFLKLKTLEK